jgi:hypothetical protein
MCIYLSTSLPYSYLLACFRLGLIGYGVRVHDNVLHHENQKVACEILDLAAEMRTSCLMTDEVDEVSEE